MRSTFILLAAATALTACSMLPFGEEEGDRPTLTAAAAAPAATTPAVGISEAQIYEIKNADRGMVRRVKVLLNGRTVDTLVMSRERSEPTSYCCTGDGCQEMEAAKACTSFKMTCDKDGACNAHTSAIGNGRL
jgi:hypothetical protein